MLMDGPGTNLSIMLGKSRGCVLRILAELSTNCVSRCAGPPAADIVISGGSQSRHSFKARYVYEAWKRPSRALPRTFENRQKSPAQDLKAPSAASEMRAIHY